MSFFQQDPSSDVKVPKHSDSGLESIREDESFKSVENSMMEADLIPVAILVTCTNVRLALHKYEKSEATVTAEDVRLWRRYHHAHRVTAARVSRVSAGDSEESEAEDREERDVLAPPQP